MPLVLEAGLTPSGWGCSLSDKGDGLRRIGIVLESKHGDILTADRAAIEEIHKDDLKLHQAALAHHFSAATTLRGKQSIIPSVPATRPTRYLPTKTHVSVGRQPCA
jgi:hypothetical protein